MSESPRGVTLVAPLSGVGPMSFFGREILAVVDPEASISTGAGAFAARLDGHLSSGFEGTQ